MPQRKNYRNTDDRSKCCNTCERMYHLTTDGWALCSSLNKYAMPENVFKYDVCDEYKKITISRFYK